MRRIILAALGLLVLCGVSNAQMVGGPRPACTAFGTTSGTCIQGAGALGTPSSGNGTNITNVNAATLGGATFASPGTIGGTTAGVGNFSSVRAGNTSTTLGVGFAATAPTLTYNTDNGVVFDSPGNAQIAFGFQPSGSFPMWMQARGASNVGQAFSLNGLGGVVTIGGSADSTKLGSSLYTICTALTTSSNAIGCTASDARLKTDMGMLSPVEALSFALAVPVRKYGFANPKHAFSDDRLHVGFYAQEIKSNSPSLAKFMVSNMMATDKTPGGTMTVDYSQSGPIAIAAIKALQKEIDILNAKVSALTAQKKSAH